MLSIFTASLINKTSKRNYHLPKQKAEQQSLKDIQENGETHRLPMRPDFYSAHF